MRTGYFIVWWHLSLTLSRRNATGKQSKVVSGWNMILECFASVASLWVFKALSSCIIIKQAVLNMRHNYLVETLIHSTERKRKVPNFGWWISHVEISLPPGGGAFFIGIWNTWRAQVKRKKKASQNPRFSSRHIILLQIDNARLHLRTKGDTLQPWKSRWASLCPGIFGGQGSWVGMKVVFLCDKIHLRTITEVKEWDLQLGIHLKTFP